MPKDPPTKTPDFRDAKLDQGHSHSSTSTSTSTSTPTPRHPHSPSPNATPPAPKRNRCLRATDAQWREIGERARQAGYTRTAYLLTTALAGRPRPRPDQPTRDAIYHLARIGNNLNQLTHAANTPNRIVDQGRLNDVLDQVVLWLETYT